MVDGAAAGSSAAGACGSSGCVGAAPFSGWISASSWPTVTVSPSDTWSLMTVPVAGLGTSTSTLSVEISTIVASASIRSPSWTCHSRISPSVTDSPAPGATTWIVVSTAM